MGARPTKEQIKQMADRAEARSDGAIDDDDAEWERGFNETCDKAMRSREIIEAEIGRLALLSDIEYAIERKPAAERLDIGLTVLESLVKGRRPKERKAEEETDFLPHWKVEPWLEAVDGTELLNELRQYFNRHAVTPKHADIVLALWVLHTWFFERFDITPYLAITSPTRRCGKSLVLTILQWLCCRAKKNDSMSKAAIYRSVEAERPTLVLDETSWVVDLKDERQGILCGGFERNGFVEVCEGESANITVRRYSTYCPKAFGIIGKLTPTLMDRSIEIAMQRKTRLDKVERLGRRDNADYARLRQQCLRWASDNREALATITPQAPEGLNDRALDIWEPLLAIAEHAGGEWRKLACDAAVTLSGGESAAEERSVELLHDIKTEFDRTGTATLTTKTLVAALCVDEERPWATWNKGKPISDRQLAKLLKPFVIISENVPTSEPRKPQAKGYCRAHFNDAFERYLTPANDSSCQFGGLQASKRNNADETGITRDFSIRLETDLDGSEKCEKPANDGHKYAYTDKTPLPGDEACNDEDSLTVCQHCGAPATARKVTSAREL
jgi:hypothetical protein